jgi:hypothetical protein
MSGRLDLCHGGKRVAGFGSGCAFAHGAELSAARNHNKEVWWDAQLGFKTCKSGDLDFNIVFIS